MSRRVGWLERLTLAAFLSGQGKDLGKFTISMPGFPLSIPTVGTRPERIKVRKRLMRQRRRARINRRGY